MHKQPVDIVALIAHASYKDVGSKKDKVVQTPERGRAAGIVHVCKDNYSANSQYGHDACEECLARIFVAHKQLYLELKECAYFAIALKKAVVVDFLQRGLLLRSHKLAHYKDKLQLAVYGHKQGQEHKGKDKRNRGVEPDEFACIRVEIGKLV